MIGVYLNQNKKSRVGVRGRRELAKGKVISSHKLQVGIA